MTYPNFCKSSLLWGRDGLQIVRQGSDFWKAFLTLLQAGLWKGSLADQGSGDQPWNARFTSCATYFQVTKPSGFGRAEARAGQTDEEALQATYSMLEHHSRCYARPPSPHISELGWSPLSTVPVKSNSTLLNFHIVYILDRGHFLNEVIQ